MSLNITQMQINALPPARHKLKPFSILSRAGKDGQAKVNSDLLPWTSTCTAGSSDRVPAECTTREAGSRSGHDWEVPWVGFNRIWREERLRQLATQFWRWNGNGWHFSMKTGQMYSRWDSITISAGSRSWSPVWACIPCLPLVWHLLDRLSGQSALMCRTWHSHLPCCVTSYCARPRVTRLQCDLEAHTWEQHLQP